MTKQHFKRIDAHQHFWKLKRGDYRWLTPDLECLYRDFLPEDLERQLSDAGISHTVVVQAADSVEETRFLLALAEKTPFIAGVVGWVDMAHADAVSTLQDLARNPYMKGIRPMLQDIDDPNWIMNPALSPIFELLIENHLCFDALVRTDHLSNILHIARRYPDLKIVINHCAKPAVTGEISNQWSRGMIELSGCQNVSVKLSGLVTEADTDDVTADLLWPYVDTVLALFGANRVLWGSDWPVLNLNGSYSDWDELSQSLLANLSGAEQQKVYALNAIDLYSLTVCQE